MKNLLERIFWASKPLSSVRRFKNSEERNSTGYAFSSIYLLK